MIIIITLPICTDEEREDASDYISKSRLALYAFCEIKYRKQYIEKCLPYESSHASSIGSRFHEHHELFMAVAHKYPVDKWMDFIHPDFNEEERPMLKWSIQREIERYKENPDYFTPIGLEYRIVDHENKLRGIIDRIDQINEKEINVIEYKTTQTVSKQKLQMEFGFYDILLDCIDELKGMKRTYTVINPRLQKVVSFNPSRKSTIFKKVQAVRDAIENDDFKPTCGLDVDTFTLGYATNFCTICSLEEIAEYNGLVNYRVA